MQETDFFVAVLEGDLALLHSKEEDGLDSLEEDADFIKWIILFMFPEGLRALFCFLFIESSPPAFPCCIADTSREDYITIK